MSLLLNSNIKTSLGPECLMRVDAALPLPLITLTACPPCVTGEYDGHLGKDAVQKAAPGFSIGMGAREGKVKHPKSLSVSRSIQHGIDWHIPVLIQVRPAGADAAKPESRSMPSPPQPAGEEYWGEGQEDGNPDRGRGAEPPLPPPVGGKVPPPPAAVARSIRRPVQGAPSEWDWQRLGHNYRNNWTTLHGGAFSQGRFA